MSHTTFRPGATSSQTPVSAVPSGFLKTTSSGLRHVEDVMGMPWMFDICDETVGIEALRSSTRWLHWVDATFSTYRADSEISRLNRGELAPEQLHADVREVLDRCELLRRDTDGYFDIAAPYRSQSAPHRRHSVPDGARSAPDGAHSAPIAGYGGPGSVDPSGLVKGWAIARVTQQLRDTGARSFCVNAGGDAQLSGHPDGDDRWRVGIQHPRSVRDIAMTLGLRDLAIATSGAYVRGAHIHDPIADRAPSGLLSVTIVGPDVATADAYATAAFAMGATRGGRFCAGLRGYDAVLIREDDTVVATPGIDELRV